MPPTLSLVIPTRNRLDYLRRSVASCFQQSRPADEVVVVDDCSTDGTPEWLGGHGDPRLRVLRNETPQTLPVNLNRGLAACRGGVLGWLGDDDYFLEGAFESLLGVLTSESAQVAYSDVLRIGPEGQVVGRWLAGPPEYLTRLNVVGAGALFTREVFERLGGYDPAFFLAEDYDFWVRAWQAGFRFRHLERPLCAYQLHARSLTSTAGVERVRQVRDLVRRARFSRFEIAWRWVWAWMRRRWWWLRDRERYLRDRRVGSTVPLEALS